LWHRAPIIKTEAIARNVTHAAYLPTYIPTKTWNSNPCQMEHILLSWHFGYNIMNLKKLYKKLDLETWSHVLQFLIGNFENQPKMIDLETENVSEIWSHIKRIE
jgi:hypothetical protein